MTPPGRRSSIWGGGHDPPRRMLLHPGGGWRGDAVAPPPPEAMGACSRGSVLLFPTFTFPEAGGAWAGREMAGGYTAGHRGLNVTLVC